MEPNNQIKIKYCKNCKGTISMRDFDVHSAICRPQSKSTNKRQPHHERKSNGRFIAGRKRKEHKLNASSDS